MKVTGGACENSDHPVSFWPNILQDSISLCATDCQRNEPAIQFMAVICRLPRFTRAYQKRKEIKNPVKSPKSTRGIKTAGTILAVI